MNVWVYPHLSVCVFRAQVKGVHFHVSDFLRRPVPALRAGNKLFSIVMYAVMRNCVSCMGRQPAYGIRCVFQVPCAR